MCQRKGDYNLEIQGRYNKDTGALDVSIEAKSRDVDGGKLCDSCTIRSIFEALIDAMVSRGVQDGNIGETLKAIVYWIMEGMETSGMKIAIGDIETIRKASNRENKEEAVEEIVAQLKTHFNNSK